VEINWTQVFIAVVSALFGAGGGYGVFLAYRSAVRKENNENNRVNRILTDDRIDVVWKETLEMFQSERDRTRRHFDELREALDQETAKRRDVEAALAVEREARGRIEAELRAERQARQRIEAELEIERTERRREKEQTMRQLASLKQENANLKKRLLVQEKRDKQL
jgi:hypothetical protein